MVNWGAVVLNLFVYSVTFRAQLAIVASQLEEELLSKNYLFFTTLLSHDTFANYDLHFGSDHRRISIYL